MKKHMIVMMGGQGVGKGTFSKMLCAHHDFNYIETGAILRTLPPESEIAQTIARGELVSDDKLFKLMESKITGDDDVILDGFPRNLAQAQWMVKNYADKFNIHVLYLDVPEDIMVARINKRIREGAGRKDDAHPDVIRRRLDTFWKTTVPAIKWLENTPGIKFSNIDAHGTANENFAEIVAALRK